MNIRLLFIQYAGDFRETVLKFRKGEGESYYGQEYSVRKVIEMASKTEETSVLCCISESKYDSWLEEGIRTVGAGLKHDQISIKNLNNYIEEFSPTHVVLRFPHWKLIRWLLNKKINILPSFADSFEAGGLKSKINSKILAYYLNRPQVDWVINHQVNASQSLVNIGVDPSKIIAYDWEHKLTPSSYSSKQGPPADKEWTIFFAGQITRAKGLGEIIEAIALLRKRNQSVKLNIAGKGSIDIFKEQASQLGVLDAVHFMGMIPNSDVITQMNISDVVVVLSHHEYPEGFPMTLMEAMISRTPLITTDHPMFVGKINEGESGLIVPQKSSLSVADAIEKLIKSPKLYEEISIKMEDVWDNLQLSVKWADIIECWLWGDTSERKRLQKFTIARTPMC